MRGHPCQINPLTIAAIAAPQYGDAPAIHTSSGFPPVETGNITCATGLVGVAENCHVRVNALARFAGRLRLRARPRAALRQGGR